VGCANPVGHVDPVPGGIVHMSHIGIGIGRVDEGQPVEVVVAERRCEAVGIHDGSPVPGGVIGVSRRVAEGVALGYEASEVVVGEVRRMAVAVQDGEATSQPVVAVLRTDVRLEVGVDPLAVVLHNCGQPGQVIILILRFNEFGIRHADPISVEVVCIRRGVQ